MSEIRSYFHMTRRFAKYSLTGVLALLALVVLVIGGKPDQAQAAQVKCPQFRVMHNDKIGNVSFPAGYYNVTLLNGDKLTCPRSTKLFQEFLQDWDGRLRSPWILRLNGKNRVFRAGAGSDLGFIATPASQSGGGGGGNSGRSCPGLFRVLHNDSIGSFKIPAGNYRLTLIDPAKMNCAQAVKRFQEFLLDFDGRLPAPWKLNVVSGIFYKSTAGRTGFKINRAYGPNPGPVNRFVRCPATFRVLHNDRIGALALPRGPYYIYVVNNLSCSQASNYFRQFLNRTDGRLPSPWRLNVAKAKFNTGAGGPAFRVQKA
ncbi:MAG: hypothetical protein KDB52_06135 [Solirubrobacterales bacterium]|nr:hypothetical protein [Solirubrobacterales bacterium]